MSISAVQIVAGPHQQSRERDSGSPCLAGRDPLLCKKIHSASCFTASDDECEEKSFLLRDLTIDKFIHFPLVVTLDELSSLLLTVTNSKAMRRIVV